MAFCDKKYRPKATLPDRGTNHWAALVGLGDREYLDYNLWEIMDEPLFELDIFDYHDAEGVIKSIESGSDHTGGLYRLAIMVNSGYKNNSMISSIHQTDICFRRRVRGYLWRIQCCYSLGNTHPKQDSRISSLSSLIPC